MLLQSALPAGDPVAPEQGYGDLRLEDLAPADRPYVIANFITSVDGRATLHGRSGEMSDAADRAAFHLLRSQVDAIVAGTGTLRTENYGRLVRDRELEQRRVAQGRDAQPLAVVLSASGVVPWDIPLFEDPDSRVAVFARPETVLPDLAAEVVLHPTADPHDELVAVLGRLRHELGIRTLLCEGGPALLNAMLAARVLDELFLTLAPVLAGAGELPVTTGAAVEPPISLRLLGALEHDGTLLLRYRRADAR